MTLWYLFILALTLVFFSLVTYYALSHSLYNIVQSDSRLTGIQPENPLSAETKPENNFNQPVPIMSYVISEEWLSALKTQSRSLLSIYTTQGQVLVDQKDYINDDMVGDQQVRLFLRYSSSSPGFYEVLVSTQPISEVNNTLEAFKNVLYIAIPIIAILTGGFGFLLIWRMLRPVSEISRAAHAIEETDLSRRIEVKSDDELGQLSMTLNQTFERLQKAFEREHQFTADASHELRTPLAIMQGEATLALNKERSQEEYRRSLEIISQETAHMSSIINKLLVLARADSGKERLSLKPVNLNKLLTEIASDIEVLCDDKSLHFKLELWDEITIQGDETKLRELFLNLLDNAVHYTPAGGSITLSLTRKENHAIIAVKDSGIGIAKEHLPHIFKRFYRVEKNRYHNEGGAGLGLAICQGIAELHGGKITVESQVGAGSTFSVLLPISR
jgi:heavy metal sensor kinase